MWLELTMATECGVGPVISLVRLFFTALSSMFVDAHNTEMLRLPVVMATLARGHLVTTSGKLNILQLTHPWFGRRCLLQRLSIE